MNRGEEEQEQEEKTLRVESRKGDKKCKRVGKVGDKMKVWRGSNISP
jgi:hypothetical protein